MQPSEGIVPGEKKTALEEIKFTVKKVSELTPQQIQTNLEFLYPIFAPDWPGYEKLLYSDPGTQECIMAFKGDKLVGHAAITRREVKLKDGLTEVIGGAGDLAVAEECRGLGIGRELDLKCKEIMKESGYNLGLIFCHGDVEAHHKANGWLEKEKGSVWATVDKEIRPQEIAMYWPIKMSEEEKDIWKNGDIYIGEGNW